MGDEATAGCVMRSSFEFLLCECSLICSVASWLLRLDALNSPDALSGFITLDVDVCSCWCDCNYCWSSTSLNGFVDASVGWDVSEYPMLPSNLDMVQKREQSGCCGIYCDNISLAKAPMKDLS